MKNNMMKKGQMVDGGVNKFLFVGILFIIGVVFFVVIAGIVSDQTTLTPQVESNLKYNGTVTITLANIPVDQITSFADNSSGVALVEGDNYSIDVVTGIISNGTGNVIAVGDHNDTGYNITYRSVPAGFIQPGTNQTVVLIIPILFLVVLILFVFAAQQKGKQ